MTERGESSRADQPAAGGEPGSTEVAASQGTDSATDSATDEAYAFGLADSGGTGPVPLDEEAEDRQVRRDG